MAKHRSVGNGVTAYSANNQNYQNPPARGGKRPTPNVIPITPVLPATPRAPSRLPSSYTPLQHTQYATTPPTFSEIIVAISVFIGSVIATTVQSLVLSFSMFGSTRGGEVTFRQSNDGSTEAELFVPEGPPPDPPDCSKETRWYVVFVGRKVGVFNDWAEVQQSTVGVPGNTQRRYSSAAKAISAFNAALASGSVSQVDIENDITIHPPKTWQWQSRAHNRTSDSPQPLRTLTSSLRARPLTREDDSDTSPECPDYADARDTYTRYTVPPTRPGSPAEPDTAERDVYVPHARQLQQQVQYALPVMERTVSLGQVN